jgi:hypothetical protein
MKRIQINILLLSMVIAVLAAVASYGQSTQYRGTIPFDFTARGRKMKAGDYNLRALSGGLLMQQRSGKSSVILGPASNRSAGAGDKGKLIFVRDGDSYALTEVATPVFSLKLKHTATSVNVAMSNSKPEIVEVSLVD